MPPKITEAQLIRTGAPGRASFRGLGIAGGAPGMNAVLEPDEGRGYAIIVMSNYDPPTAEKSRERFAGGN